MKFGKFLLLLTVCLLTVQFGWSQQLTTNENGEKIIVYSDGTWKYAEEEDIAKMNEKGAGDQKQEMKEPIENDLEIAIQIAEDAAAAEADAKRMEEDAKYERILISDELKDAEDSDGEYFDDEIKEIKERLKAAKKKEKKAKSAYKLAAKKAKEAAKLITMNPEDRTKELQKYAEYQNQKKSEDIAAQEPVGMFPGEIPEKESQEAYSAAVTTTVMPAAPERQTKTFAKYNPANDVMFNPPRTGCTLAFDGVDEFSGKKRKDVERQLFFTYTNEELRPVFKDRDYMTCTGYLSSLSGGLKFLTLNITIASKTAQREYGVLEKGGLINIKLLNGDNVRLVNSKTNIGMDNPLDGTVSYRAQYIITSGDEKKLKKSEVNKIRIIWSSGYEDYEIYELDFFKDQFKCLDRK